MTPALTQKQPASSDRREDLWLEEKYWGHRLWDQQSPWLVFLEFLCVAESAHRQGYLFDFEKSQYPSWYRPYARVHLRNILFNNEQYLIRIDREISDSDNAWRKWLAWMAENSHGLNPDERDFSYLRSRFNSFHDFAQLVRALRSCTVEGDTNKRWSSRFIFPFGSSAIFEDLSIKQEGTSREYINFGRSGELLYLVTSGAFGLLLYHLHTSAQLLERTDMPPIVCEIVAPRRGLVREQSIESYEFNTALSIEAIDSIISSVEDTEKWNETGQPQEVLHRRRAILADLFSWDDEESVTNADDLLRRFREEAKGRHRRHFAQVHRTFGRGIGLVSRRGTNRFRYAPTDGLLKCLVFCNVNKRTEFNAFLAQLYERYGLVFGEREAEKALTAQEIDKKPFQSNALRLEQRLSSLGLLKRLSDACAYVENPYSG